MEKKSSGDNNFGVAAVVLGILSIVFAPVFLGGILGVVALVFSLIQRRRNNNKWALSGIVLAVIGILLSLMVFFAAIAVIKSLKTTLELCLSNPSLPGCEEIAKAYGL